MKIAMIGHKRIPGREGGIEVVVEELCVRMHNLGEQIVAYNRISKKRKRYTDYKGVDIINIPTIEKKSTDALIYSLFASIHATLKRFDIIHYHGIGPSVMLIIPHIFGIKTVVTVHGLNYKTPKWKGLGAKIMKLGEKITAKYANEIIVLSKEQKKYFKDKYNRETNYIPNGTKIQEMLKPNKIKKWNLEEKKYILFVSRIVPGKGLEYLIEAYKQLDTNMPLIIAGNSVFVDDYYRKITDLIEGDKRIKMIGFVEGKTLNELYSNAKVFVFPSEAEGMPMCLLEALSYNCNSIVSDIPENLEVLKDYGVAFENKNVKDLKEKLENMINDVYGEFYSRDYIIKNFEWDEVVKKTIEVYKK